MRKDHKFFEAYLDNDLEDIRNYLDKKLDDMIAGKLFDLSKLSPGENYPGWYSDKEANWNRYSAAPTQLLSKYNLLKDDYEPFKKLHIALKELTIEACEYYGVDFNSQNYQVMAWFNYDYGMHKFDPEFLHDHNHGRGVPDFHGYYCVDAEPSVTHYQIYREPDNMFLNVNKDNRVVVSETGHPHSRGDWNDPDRPRITIAYDILPFEPGMGTNFVKL